MPEKRTLAKVRRDKQLGRSPSTQADEFVREEIDHIRQGVHGARSTKQTIAIGLSKARRAGVDIPSKAKRKNNYSLRSAGKRKKGTTPSSAKRAHASLQALRRESRNAASRGALSRFAKASARKRGMQNLRRAAAKAARTRKRTQKRTE
jgi:hypothetical protein